MYTTWVGMVGGQVVGGVAVCEGGSVVKLPAVESWNYPACNGELSF